MKKTRKAYEKYLNNLYMECYDRDIINQLIYLTSKARKLHLSEQGLLNAFHNGKLGAVIRKYDPIAFNKGFNKWEGEQQ